MHEVMAVLSGGEAPDYLVKRRSINYISTCIWFCLRHQYLRPKPHQRPIPAACPMSLCFLSTLDSELSGVVDLHV